MASQNTYLAYKRDTRHLLYWMIRASNNIIKSSPTAEDDATEPLNTTGQITVSDIVLMSKRIAKHINPVPAIVSKKPDAEIEKSNASHKYFIDSLTEAFEALGGQIWQSRAKTEDDKNKTTDQIEKVVFSNKFNALNLNTSKEGDEDEGVINDDDSDPEDEPAAGPQRRQHKKSSGKGKKGKKGKKPKKKQRPAATKDTNLDDELPDYRRRKWHYLNGAVAGCVSNLAIAMVKRTGSAMFVDFPGHDSYETVMQTITRGDPEKAQSNFTLTLYSHEPGPRAGITRKVEETKLDMLAEIQGWDPNFDLQRATNEQRLKWRRAYTINWLYDLVNLFSSIVVQRNTLKGQHHLYERVDWSIQGPWNVHRRLFGLNEFAGTITSLAMQKQGTDVRQKILPYHVFQLQCIVDSMTVSRGWSLSGLRGHVLHPPAKTFRPRRDVDLFLDRQNERTCSGYLQAVDVLKQFFEKDGILHGNPERHRNHFELLKGIQEDFINWLGETKYMYGFTTIPPSRFSNTNANGLWEYSPFLCGVGLMEGLELAYLMGMLLLDRMPEPFCLVHLHNMLVQKGYISQPVGLYASLEDIYATAFFVGGKIPTSDFGQAFLERVNASSSRRAEFKRRSLARTAAKTAVDVHGVMDVNANRFFRTNSTLALYRQADWNPDRIPESDIQERSALAIMRLAQTKQVVDPVTGKTRFEDTELVSRERAVGIDEEVLLKTTSDLRKILTNDNMETPEALKAFIPEGQHMDSTSRPTQKIGESTKASQKPGDFEISGVNALELLKSDIYNDVCGGVPLSSLNFIWVMVRFMMLFTQFEERLSQLRNPLYVRAYETDREWFQEKRLGLTVLALFEQDEECLKIMAREFESPRAGFMNHVYWEDLQGIGERMSRSKRGEHDQTPDCTVM
ncbi:hypothetical protein SLS62_007408 [Diatrype stigma]|uniref:DUF6604 domain-containing protein n=1 Tax=Diatrype stigma TaxID=117547 RepID=A0AAN9YMB3_9PEZI